MQKWQEHNLWLLVLAALICAITSTSAFLMLGSQQRTNVESAPGAGSTFTLRVAAALNAGEMKLAA